MQRWKEKLSDRDVDTLCLDALKLEKDIVCEKAKQRGIDISEQYCEDSRWADIVAAETLTGVSSREVEEKYEFEACTGQFAYGWIPARYYEGIKFGRWVTDEFVSCVERGHYEIDPEDQEYREYLKQKKAFVLDLLSEKYPNEMAVLFEKYKPAIKEADI